MLPTWRSELDRLLAAVRANKQLPGILLIAPAALTMAALLGYPVLFNLWLGFFKKDILLPEWTWVGLHNYAFYMFDQQFWSSFALATLYMLLTMSAQLVLGVGVALLLNEGFRGQLLVRGVALFPYMIPVTLSVIIWRWLFNNQYGVVNWALLEWGLIKEPVIWLGPDYIFWSLIVVSIWTYFPFVLISVLARLQTIPPELYEAAKVDGAGPWSRFAHITVPQLRTVLFIIILLRGVWMFTKFDIVWLWGSQSWGAAGEELRILPVYTYHRIFNMFQAGSGAALANIMFMILLIAAFLYFKVYRREETL